MTIYLLTLSLILGNPSHRVPHYSVKEGLWSTTAELVNPTTNELSLTLTFQSGDGLSQETNDLVLAPMSSWVGPIEDLVDQLPAPTGWIEIEASLSEFTGLLQFQFIPTGGTTSMPIMPTEESALRLTMATGKEFGIGELGFALLNPYAEDISVALRLVGRDGRYGTPIQHLMKPRSTWVAMLQDVLGGSQVVDGWVEVLSNQPLQGLALAFKQQNQQIIAVPCAPNADGLREHMQMAIDQEYQLNPWAGAIVGLSESSRAMTVVAAGYANRETQEPMTTLHAGEIGSITKTFVAALALKIQEEGTLDLDDIIESWFPQVPYAERITLRMLLNHTSGLPDCYTEAFYLDMIDSVVAGDLRTWSTEDMLTYALAEPFTFEPGAGGSYSNTGYILIARILEQATGKTLAELLRTRILDPLGLNHTWLQDAEEARNPAWMGYLYDEAFTDEPIPLTGSYHRSCMWGPAGIASTPQDLIVFFDRLLRGHLLQPDSLLEMLTPARQDDGTDYGLGIGLIFEAGELVFAWHNGGWADGTSFAVHNMQSHETIAAQCNHDRDQQVSDLMVLASQFITSKGLKQSGSLMVPALLDRHYLQH